MALSGRINGTVGHFSQFFSFYLLWSATQDPVANTSTITATTYWSTTDRGQDFDTVGTRTAYITIAGNQTSITKRFDVSPWPTNAVYEIQTKTYTVSHDADGTKSVSISAYADGTASSYGPDECSLSGTITLDTIDRTAPEITLSLASRSATSLNISATATASCDLWEYKLGSGAWTQFSTTDATAVSCELTGLNPGQTYSVQIRARKTYNHVVGTSSSASYTTLGAATLNSVQPFYADASTVSIALSTEVYNASYTYSLAIKNGNSTYLTITGLSAKPVGTQNYSITLTSSQRTTLLNAMANVASFSATFVLTSLNNSTTIGTSSTTATISTSAATSGPNAPTFSFKDSNAATVAVTGDNTKLIQGQSTLQITSLSATAKNGASIANYNITVGGVTVTTASGGTVNIGEIPQSGTLACKVTVTDSRGYTSSTTQNITCYAYALPEMTSGVAVRDDIDTTYVGFTFAGTYSVVGINTVTGKYKYKKTTEQNYSSDIALTLTVSSGTFSFSNAHVTDFDADYSYDVVLTISDLLNPEEYVFVVPPYAPLIGYRIDGIGINKVPRSGYSADLAGVVGVGGVDVPDSTQGGKFLKMKGDGSSLEWGDVTFPTLADVAYSGDYDDLENTPTPPFDYIVDQGTEGNWVYRKYNSGVAECWGNFTVTVTGWSAWGNVYEATRSANLAPSYPTGLFNATPVLNVNIWHPSIGTMGCELYGIHDSTVVPSIIPLRPNTGGTGTLGVCIHSVGTWK
jgi:hypothetical protein